MRKKLALILALLMFMYPVSAGRALSELHSDAPALLPPVDAAAPLTQENPDPAGSETLEPGEITIEESLDSQEETEEGAAEAPLEEPMEGSANEQIDQQDGEAADEPVGPGPEAPAQEPVEEPDAEQPADPTAGPVPEVPVLEPILPEAVVVPEPVGGAAEVPTGEIDLEAGGLEDKYFVVQYADGTIKTMKVLEPAMRSLQSTGAAVATIDTQMALYEQDPEVELVEPLIIRRTADIEALALPNDPHYLNDLQWGLEAIRADRLNGWSYDRPLSDITIAVLDTGMDMNHPDLADCLATVNVDGQEVHGYDVVNDDYDPSDGDGHGTHVAGIAAAIANNGTGIAGVASGVKILPVKVMNDAGTGTQTDVVKGINWAVSQGVDIISMSLGSPDYSEAEQIAINNAHAQGIVVVAAAGNGSNNWSSGPADIPLHNYPKGAKVAHAPVIYPAACDNVIGVGALGIHEGAIAVADFSNSGTGLDVVAPGEDVFSTMHRSSGEEYGLMSGTSMATPHVAGLAALILAKNEGYSPDDVEDAMKKTCGSSAFAGDTTYGGNPAYYGAGMVDAYTAVAGDVRLAGMLLDKGSWTFDPSRTEQPTLDVGTEVAAIGIKPVMDNEDQLVTINGTAYSGSEYYSVPLNIGANIITVVVTAKDLPVTTTYTLVVSRAAKSGSWLRGLVLSAGVLSPAFDTKVTDYNAQVGNAVVQMSLTPEADDGTVITINGTVCPSGKPYAVALKTGSNPFVVQVQAQGSEKNSYTLVVTRAAAAEAVLHGLSISAGTLTPAFAADKTAYSAQVANAVTQMTLTPVAAENTVITVNGTAAPSGKPYAVTLKIGANPFNVKVRTPEGAEKTYSLVVTRAEAVIPPPPPAGGGGGGGGGGGSADTVVKISEETELSLNTLTVTFPSGSYRAEFQAELGYVTYSSTPFPKEERLIDKVYVLRKNIDNDLYKAVNLTFTVQAKDVDLSKERLAVYYLDGKTNKWKELPGVTVDEKKLTLKAETEIFTEYAVIALKREAAVVAPVVTIPVSEVPAAAIPTPVKTVFTDLAGHWSEKQVDELVAKKAISGYPDGTFRPNAPITRSEFIAVLVKAQGMTGTKEAVYPDLAGHWAQAVINTGFANGVVSGYPDGLFHPNDPITREQMAVMVDRTLRYTMTTAPQPVADQAKISPWAKEAIERMLAYDVMGGYPDGTFRPQALATRAEAVAVILKSVTGK